MGSTWVETALRAVYVVAITRYLGAELFGVWAYAAAIYTLAVGLVGFGFEALLPIRLGTDKGRAAVIAGVTLALRLGLLGLAAVGLLVYALAAEPAGTARTVLLMILPAMLGRGLSFWARTVFLAYEQVGAYVRMAAALRLVEVVAGVALLAAGAGLLAIVALHSAVWLAEAAAGLRMVQRRLTPCRPRLDRAQAGEFLRQGAVLGLAAAFMSWLMAGPLVLFRHADGDMVALGQLGLALQLTMLVVASVQPFFAAALPVLSRSVERGDPRLASYGGLTALGALVIFGAAAALALPFGRPLVLWAFGPEFALAGELIAPCMLIGAMVLAPTGYGQLLVVRGWRWPGAAAGGAGALVLLAALPPAAAGWGPQGAVLSVGLAWLARAVVLIGTGASRSRASMRRAP